MGGAPVKSDAARKLQQGETIELITQNKRKKSLQIEEERGATSVAA